MSNNAPAKKASASVLFGAAFLMATSAIGPGFLTQTSTFTAQYGAPLIMIIITAICMDIVAQTNIWSIIGVSGMRAQDVANKMLPGLGVFLAIIVAIGGKGLKRRIIGRSPMRGKIPPFPIVRNAVVIRVLAERQVKPLGRPLCRRCENAAAGF